MNSQKGFSPVFILLVVAIIGLVGTVGYYVYSNNKPAKTVTKTTVTKTTTDTTATDQKTAVPTGTTATIDTLTLQDASGEASIDSKYADTEQTTAQSANSAAASVGGSFDESSL